MSLNVKLSIHSFFEFIILLQIVSECSCINNTRDVERPGRNLCINNHEDVDCSNQVKFLFSPASCSMKYLNRTSDDCADAQFEGRNDGFDEFGEVNVTPIPWFDNSFIFPSLNITFTNIHWERLRMRFVRVGSNIPQICREFYVSDNIDPSSVISFDCLWGTIAEEHFRFQYLLTTKDGREVLHTYLLQVPKDTDVERGIAATSYRLFMMMDQTAFPYISAKLQIPSVKFNASLLNIALYYKQELESSPVKLQHWTVGLSNKTEGEFVKIGPYDTASSPGYYYFNATFNSNLCPDGCIESSTPQLQVAGLKHGVQVVVAVILISVLALGLVGFLMWKNRYKKIINGSEKVPNVLFVYESSYPSQIENVYKFKEFLEDSCYIVPKLDLIDIPQTDSKNPWTWYTKAFEEADYVLVFTSPSKTSDRGIHEDNIYLNLHTYALRLLIVYLLNKPKFSVASVKLPGCSWDTLPPEALIIDKRYSLPERLNNLFRFLNVPPLKNGGSLLIQALQQPRNPPQFSVPKPNGPLILPFDAGDFDVDNEAQGPLVVCETVLNLDGQSSSEEEEDSESDHSVAGLKLS